MVVEDDPINMLLISEVMRKMGFDIIRANNGKEALEHLTTLRSRTYFYGCEYAGNGWLHHNPAYPGHGRTL